MNYASIKDCDVADGPGVRVTIFVSGCTNHCEGCFQPQTWDFGYGEPYTQETENRIISLLARPYIRGLTLLGGEPFEPDNQRALLPLLQRVRKELPDRDIWSFSGFTLDTLLRDGSHPRCEVTDSMLSLLDVLVDGPFILAKRNLMLRFRGSENQRILDMKKTLAAGQPVTWEG